jgi:hypothetical protein
MLTVINITNPIYGNAEGTHINCQIQFEEFPNEILPFGANEQDPEPHGKEIYKDLKSGKYGEIAPYVPPVIQKQPNTTGTTTA